PDLAALSEQCARLLVPGGILLFTVIGRICPWEMGHYLRRGQWSRLAVRYARSFVPVRLNQRTVWARYYTPRAFFRPFARHFSLLHYRGLCIFVPPPYLVSFRQRHERWHRRLWQLDRQIA